MRLRLPNAIAGDLVNRFTRTVVRLERMATSSGEVILYRDANCTKCIGANKKEDSEARIGGGMKPTWECGTHQG